MIFGPDAARLVLVLHAVLGALVVGLSTHLVVWAHLSAGGQPGRVRALRRFAGWALVAYVGQFAVGNILYPTYKVRVRAAYFDAPAITQADGRLRDQATQALLPGSRPDERIDLSGAGRLFDIKEHLAALGLPWVFLAWLVARRWTPRDDDAAGGTRVGTFVLVGSWLAALCAWSAAVIGLWITAIRSPG